ncbi:acyltransferase family protein [Vibrio sp. BS-M-Sm-2]|uniref:acyltransferase family protein n=1 Tax=Vibrio sp. BS-M-Sm-2 TaxID=3241167 RepID=UPI0035564D5C
MIILSVYLTVNNINWSHAHLIPEDYGNVIYLIGYLITTGGAMLSPWWFVPMIMCLFITSPFVIKIMNSKWFTIILLLSLTFTFTTFRPDQISPLDNFYHWFGVFLLGGYICKYYKFLEGNKYVVFFTSVVFSFVSLYYENDLKEMAINGSHVVRFCMSFMSFMFLSSLLILEKNNFKFQLLNTLAKYSFGMFFLHAYFINISRLFVVKFGSGVSIYIITVVASIFGTILVVKLVDFIIEKYVSQYLSIDSRTLVGC